MSFSIFEQMFTALDGALAGIIAVYAGMVGWISGPLRVGVTIYIILLGIAVIRGAVEYPFRELIYRATKLAAVVFAVTSLYGASVGLLAMDGLPSEVANAVGASNVNGLGDFFDDMMNGSLRAIGRMREIVQQNTDQEGTNWAGFSNNWDEIIACEVISVVVIISALLAAALGFAICAFALFALALLAAVGPVFVAALLFDATRSFFFQWLGNIVNYVVLVAFALLVTVFITNTGDAFVDSITNDDPLVFAAAKALGFYALGFFFFLQVPGLAAGLGGGGASLATQFANAAVAAPLAASVRTAGKSTVFAARAAYSRARAGTGGGTLRNNT
ncbi:MULTISPECIES: type IV secretion system protein [unclassified Sphingomonas]|jgi:type IV secretion system protein VirB6|uniref:type IV secretion system protein n=1 Tax=unclassified Sphingomonas TaxID=196159 RepID=UPI0008374C3B|nr:MULTISPECIES: type IV secretion system protein [unclassified Sphingomonas]